MDSFKMVVVNAAVVVFAAVIAYNAILKFFKVCRRFFVKMEKPKKYL